MTTEQHTQPAREFWTPRWAQSERNWVVLMVVLALPAYAFHFPFEFVLIQSWPAFRWLILGDWRVHKLDDFPPQHERLKAFSPVGRGAAGFLALFALLAVLTWLTNEVEPLVRPIGTAVVLALWLYVFYSLSFNRLVLSLRSRFGLAIKAAPTASTEPESPASARILTATKAFLLLNLGAYLGAALLARAYGLSTGWPGDSETAVMAWKGVAIALAMLTAFVLPFLVPYRREHREDHVYLLAVGTLALALWL